MEVNENIEEKLERLLEEKDWSELSQQERTLVLERLGSAEQYTLMRKIGSTLVSKKPDLSPDPEILKRLHRELSRVQRPVLWRLLEWKVPAYAMAIPILIATGVYFTNLRTDPPRPSITKVVRDTVYVAGSSDTVYVDRVVVRYVEKASPAPAFSVVSSPTEEPVTDGVNMKENEELEKLLVSGS